nr:MAG TPA: hypothetical protein [Caudoviricetes sp.]
MRPAGGLPTARETFRAWDGRVHSTKHNEL